MAEQTIARPDIIDDTNTTTTITGEHGVIVFNNEHNTFDEVTGILVEATGCPMSEAEMETWEIHNQGRSLVHYGEREECERAAAIIARIGIQVLVDKL